VCLFIFLLRVTFCFADSYFLEGKQVSEIDYYMEQEIAPTVGTSVLMICYVVPQNFQSISYNQEINNFETTFSKNPDRIVKSEDKYGNVIHRAIWKNPKDQIKVTFSFRAVNQISLEPLQTNTSFPIKELSPPLQIYLTPTELVPSNDRIITRMAKYLTSNAATQLDAVQQILTWVIDHIKYDLVPERYDVMYTLKNGKGNCQNFSHVTAALLRALGIPVRIVNGVTLEAPYNIHLTGGTFTMRMAQGRHSWIEVYFSDLGWVPFDPQQSQLFVSNRYIRGEVGLDNQETINDGMVNWINYERKREMPKFRENIVGRFDVDSIDLNGERQNIGPKNILLSPILKTHPVEMVFQQAEASASTAVDNLELYTYNTPVEFGNLDFPQGVDFLHTRELGEETEENLMVLRKNFLVETAEYVTSQGNKYAQAFIVDNPLKLERVCLALHKFGGSGQSWIELLKDDGQGNPSVIFAISNMLDLDNVPISTGYSWIDFDFREDVLLAPGRYWLALAYTGSPVINWFFTYGKPFGPIDGTRYNTMFDNTWSHSLAYEFNYRIIGKIGNPK